MKFNRAWNELANAGPKASGDLSSKITREARQDGVKKFHPNANYKGQTKSGSGMSTPIYFIENKHDEETVVKRWLEENEHVVESVGEWAVHLRISDYGEAFKKASHESQGPFNPGSQENADRECKIEKCSLCGSTDFRNLPEHLPECPKR